MALSKTCRCGRVIPYTETACDFCKTEKKEASARYDRNKRDKRSKVFYDSKQWLMVRKAVMARYNGLCAYSLLVDGKVVSADVVHHIVELRDDWDKRVDMGNLIPLSNGIHSALHLNYTEKEQNMLKELMEKWEKAYR